MHLCQTNENEINEMSIPFFKAVLKALGKSLNYAAVVNLYGNAFAKDSSKIIEQANPLYKEVAYGSGLASLLANMTNYTPSDQMTGMEWAEE